MKDNRLILSIALNSLSIGQVGFNVVRELYRRKVQCTIFPKGNVDLGAYKIEPAFAAWIERAINDRLKKVDRSVPTVAIWHVNGSEFKPSDHQYLFSFHETDSPTESEVNIVNQQDATFFSSSWSVGNFEQYGARNVSFIPLGFDEDFTEIKHRALPDEITHWILVGKWEDLRKMTGIKVKAWVKKYGGNKRHQLTLCVDNIFYQKQTTGFDMNDVYQACFSELKGKPFNVNILPHLKTNIEMNQLYNSADIDLSGYARAEGWNIPAHTATALGKWSIVSNCSAHKDWATAENSILVESTGMIRAVDRVFFQEGGPFSQGNMYDFAAEAFTEAMEKAEKKAKTPNENGVKLRGNTYAKTVDAILKHIP